MLGDNHFPEAGRQDENKGLRTAWTVNAFLCFHLCSVFRQFQGHARYVYGSFSFQGGDVVFKLIKIAAEMGVGG